MGVAQKGRFYEYASIFEIVGFYHNFNPEERDSN